MMKYFDILGRLENSALLLGMLRILPGPLRRLLDSRRNFVYAVIVHVLFLAILVFSYDWSAQPAPSRPKVNIIDAVAIDESRVQAEIDKLKKADNDRHKQDAERQRRVKEEEKHLAELQKQKQEEQKRLQEQQQKRAAEEKKARELAQQKKAEAERLEKIKKEKQALEQKRQAEQKRLAELEKKRKAEAERLKKQKEEQARLEAERKRKAEEEKKRQEAEQALQKQLAEEQAALDAERKRQEDREVDKYVEIIRQKVERNWLRPSNAREGLSCVVSVSLMPGGEVLKAHVTRSSGDPIFDSSVERAVLRASPLPLPPDAALFDRFRDLKFVFSPDS